MMNGTTPLALPSSSTNEQPLYLTIENSELIDALPYLDPLSTEYDAEVKHLVDEEMKQIYVENDNKIPDYLEKVLPPLALPHLTNPNSLASIELSRIEQQKPMERLDMSHYTSKIEQPTGQQLGQVEEWENRNKTSFGLLEHSHTSLLNLELMIRYAQASWQPLITQCSKINSNLSEQVTDIKKKIEEVNKKRKLEQIEYGNELRQLNMENEDLLKRNENILPSLASLESEVNFLKRMCGDSGILPNDFMDEDDFSFQD